MLSACDRKSAEPVDVPDYESGLTDRAWLVLDTGGDFSEAMGIQQEAVRLLREGKSREDPVAVLEQMAYFLFSKGSLEEAYSCFCEAEDSLMARRRTAPTESAVMLYGDMGQFYHRLGMIERAIAYSDSMNRLHRDIVYATAHVRAAITNERQENNALKKQLDEHRRNHAPIWIVVALTALAAIVAGIFVCRRIRRRREPGSHYYVTDEHEVRDVSGDRYPSTDSIEMHSVSAGPEVAGHNIKIDKDSGAPVALVGGALSRGMSVSCYDNICAAWSLTLISLGVMMRSITPVSEIIKVVR